MEPSAPITIGTTAMGIRHNPCMAICKSLFLSCLCLDTNTSRDSNIDKIPLVGYLIHHYNVRMVVTNRSISYDGKNPTKFC